MAIAMIYDTLKLAEQLEHEAGFDAARARAMARIFAENASGNVATREDLLVIREDLLVTKGELEAVIRATKEELEAAIRATKEELEAAIRATKEELEAAIRAVDGKTSRLRGDMRVLYWMTGTTLAGVATLLGTAITIALHVMHLG